MQRKRKSDIRDENISSKLLGTDINSADIQKFREAVNSKKTKINLDGKLNAQILKAITNKFSPEIIFSIDISNQAISSIDSLAQCQNLAILNIAQNNISSLQPLSKLTDLLILNVSKNNISLLEPLAGLQKLVNLHLEGNNIKNTSNIKPLTECSSLQNLYFQNLAMTENNPVCEINDYRKSVLPLLEKIRRLDGIPRNVQMNPGKQLASKNKKQIKMQLKNTGCFYTSKFPSVTTNFQPLQGQGQLKKSIQSCKSQISSLQKLIKVALAR